MRRIIIQFALVWIALASCASAHGQTVGDSILLSATRPDLGVPLHRECGRTSLTGQRLSDRSIATVIEVCAAHPHWFLVEQGDVSGWMVQRYIAEVIDADRPPTIAYRIATWNIEHCRDGASRGFPEFQGARRFPPRGPDDYQRLAEAIRRLDLRLVILQEIGGKTEQDDSGDTTTSSSCLDQLTAALQPAAYEYAIATSGGGHRIAFLYDTSAFFLNWTCEPSLDNSRNISGSPLYARQPFLGYFTALRDGQEMNDFVAVGVHLASGQQKVQNHTAAMAGILAWLEEERGDTSCIPENERDLLIAGDFNSNYFGPRIAAFWGTMEADAWQVLARHRDTYPATRLSGDPPAQHGSRIDYIIVSSGPGGLYGEEILDAEATVHGELIPDGDGHAYRRDYSDHLPVSVLIRIIPDND